jgi:hypothetical protein
VLESLRFRDWERRGDDGIYLRPRRKKSFVEDEDDEPPEILIGEDFQAEIPPFDPHFSLRKSLSLLHHVNYIFPLVR